MINIIDKANCCGCHACSNRCPQKCISMQADDEGFWYPKVDSKDCINCGLCEKVCPILNKSIVENQPTAYACQIEDDQIRQQSSSGGVFTIVAASVLANHGVVFGAGFDREFNVLHSSVDSIDDLSNFRGSKYVQSCIGNTYEQAKNFLNQGRQVLFSGTPCQIAGFKSYLGKEYEGVVCVDIICHGVPSPLVWEQYRNNLKNNNELMSISFRDKAFGWKRFSLKITYKNDEEYIKDLKSDAFMQGFLKNVYLRPSCYNCSFKTLARQSDITLADFWGIENILPSFDDDKGTSLILVNSNKGKEIFLAAAKQMKYEKIDIDHAIRYNSAAIKSVDYNPKRDKFFRELPESTDISQLIGKYTKVSFSRKVYMKVRLLLSQIKRKILYLWDGTEKKGTNMNNS
ncbi:Coenzyme F420 hydrogenase/dehydrogenase, beta subunit C-terminal domain [Pelosinus sp. IPA-1]|uniref:Coenzyme F420 hydrogenase/dehydrogenase, beta subunit C-terminal domain n=1 Tax=Pelosinus sp. IPA-1 TaxID=3029569 RepID=UPI0024361FA6|nr:Coenzyme F420 hydrogenase/dehydrogenase, beta subunit C-terminal domain [Pelosinus sp. IPA-1]GMB01661.1 F420H(2):quinone oxidoreductase [Pelosinus sp. IPA-1]